MKILKLSIPSLTQKPVYNIQLRLPVIFVEMLLGFSGVIYAAEVPSQIDELSSHFSTPPDSARPWVFWFWLDGNISREGITADLEAMKRVASCTPAAPWAK